MDEKITFKKFIESFKVIPKIIKLLYEINKLYLFIVIIMAIINGILPILVLQCTQNMINIIQNNLKSGFEDLLVAFGWLIIVSIIQDICKVIADYFGGVYQNCVGYNLNERIIKKANNLSLKDFEDSDTYDKVTRAKNEASSTPYQIFTAILVLISSFVTFIASLSVLMQWKPWIICFLIISPVISSYNFIKLGNLQYKVIRQRANKSRLSWYYSFLSTYDVGAKEIRIYNLGDYFLNKYKDINDEFYKEDKLLGKKKSIMNFAFKLLSQFLADIAVFLVLKSAFLGEILIGNTVTYIRAINMVQGNAEALINTTFGLYNTTLYANQFFEFFDIKDEVNSGTIQIKNINEIEFKNVSFRYPKSEGYILKNISFKINKNERIALVGENGCGKSTLVKLLTKLYEPNLGEIFVNGINIKEIDSLSIKEKIGVVFQDFNKYELTASENIYLGDLKRKNNDKEIEESAKKSEIYKHIMTLPNKFKTQLGIWFEDGVQLSGGQWQKIALARAFFRKADLYILDEPSSFLDPKAENELFNKLSLLTKNKLSLFITHRLVNVACADKIIVIKNGQIVEVGTMNELLKAQGSFYEMYILQNENYNLMAK